MYVAVILISCRCASRRSFSFTIMHCKIGSSIFCAFLQRPGTYWHCFFAIPQCVPKKYCRRTPRCRFFQILYLVYPQRTHQSSTCFFCVFVFSSLFHRNSFHLKGLFLDLNRGIVSEVMFHFLHPLFLAAVAILELALVQYGLWTRRTVTQERVSGTETARHQTSIPGQRFT